MTVPTTAAYTGPYFPNGVTTEYPFGFKVNSDSEVAVFYIEDDGSETIVPSANYTVALSSNENMPGGTVTTAGALPADGRPLFVALDPEFTQGTKFEDEGAFNQSILNPTFDAGALRSIYLRARLQRALLVPFGEAGLNLPRAAERANLYPVFAADGSLILSPGTGSDPALRGELAVDGSTLVTVKPAGANAVARPMRTKIFEIVSPLDYGGFANALDAVRVPGDTSFSGSIFVPNGIIRPGASTPVPIIHARVTGSGGGTFWPTVAAPIFTWNGLASAVESHFQGFNTYGGTDVFDVTPVGEVARLFFIDIAMTIPTGIGFKISGGLTSCVFTRVAKLGGTYGIDSAGGINNHNVLNDCSFLNHSESAIRMKGLTQGLVLRNVRVEHGGTDGKNVYDFEGAVGVRLEGGWYEAHHEFLLKLDATSSNGNLIDGIVDAGASHAGGAFKASRFDVGEKLIVFGTNVWNLITTAPKNILAYGLNEKLFATASNVWESKTPRGGKVHLRQRNIAVDTAVFDILTFTRSTSSPDALTNLQNISGILTITYTGLNSGGFASKRTERWPITITGIGVAMTIEVGVAALPNTGGANTVTVTPSEKAGGTATSKTLQLTVANHNVGAQNMIDASFEFDSNSNLSTNIIEVIAL